MIDLDTHVQIAADEMGADVCSLYIREFDELVLHATFGLEKASVGSVRMQLEEGLTGAAYTGGRPLPISEPSLHPRFRYFPNTKEEQFRSYLGIPLPDGLGVLTFQTRGPHFFTRTEINAAQLWADRLAEDIRRLNPFGPFAAAMHRG